VKVPGPSGTLEPLVKSEKTLVEAPRVTTERREPPSWLSFMLSAGLLFGGALLVLSRSAAKHTAARVSLAILLFLVGLLSAGGVFLIFVWAATDHEACYWNENILQLAPLGVAQIWLSWGVLRLNQTTVARARYLLSCAAISSVFGLTWKVLPWMRQDNFWIIALCAPTWIGGALGLAALDTALSQGAKSRLPSRTARNR